MIPAILALALLLASKVAAQCDSTAEPYKSLQDNLGLTIAYTAAGKLPCYPDSFGGTLETCCNFDQLKTAIKNVTLQTKLEWQAYLDGLTKFLNKSTEAFMTFLNSYELVIQTFNQAGYDTWKYLGINLSNRDQWEFLRSPFNDQERSIRMLYSNGSDCYNNTVNLRATIMCDLCKKTSGDYVGTGSSIFFSKSVNLYESACSRIANSCFRVFAFNYKVMSVINLYLTFAYLKYGTALPLVDPALYYQPQNARDITEGLMRCYNTSNSDCTFSLMKNVCSELLSFAKVNPFAEGGLTALNNFIRFMNSAESIATPPAAAAFPSFSVNLSSNLVKSISFPNFDYQELANSTDPLFKDIRLNLSSFYLPPNVAYMTTLALTTLWIVTKIFLL